MKYLVSVYARVLIDAKTPEEASDAVQAVVEETRVRNCGAIEDEIVASVRVKRVGAIDDDEEWVRDFNL